MKTVIEMAREATNNEPIYCRQEFTFSQKQLERFAELVRADEREACSRMRAAKPRELKPVGRGILLDEQQFCFDKGWREGAASVRSAIRARSKNEDRN
jgi:hypothetical protein